MEPKRHLAVTLAAVAGFVDVVGYLTMHHLFTAHMTGNASKLGVVLGRGDVGAAAPLALAPLLFLAGVGAGTLLLDAASRRVVLLLQAALIAAFMLYAGLASADLYALEALATLALGLQAAALTEIGGRTVRTTYVSGMLTRFAQEAVRRLRGRGDREVQLRLVGAIWLAYVSGATFGGWAIRDLSTWALAIPLAVLALAIGSS